MCTGIDSATSTYACIWCHCPAQECHLSSANWSITSTDEGARSIEESIQIATSKRKQYNVSHVPIFKTIPLTRVVVDNLHMFLRVADTLIDLLIHALLTLDRVNPYQNSCQLNPYITKDEIMRKIILINIHNLWKRNVYKTYFLP